MLELLKQPWRWLKDRIGFAGLKEIAVHPVPPETASNKTGWMYALGNATMVVFLLQVVTGAVLATKYIPSTAHAYDSLLYITNEVTLGRQLRGMHFYGASAMVVLISLHMARVFLTASYKFPRELNWLTGVGLLVLTLAMAFTGQLLRWDENGVWSVSVASFIAARVPLVGRWLAEFILAGDRVGGTTLSRFFAFHVFIFPVLIFGAIGAHVYLVLHHGISELPRAGQPVDPATYRERYHALLEREGRPYMPDVTWREIAIGVGITTIIAGLAYVFGPRGPNAPPDPAVLAADPRPDWFFLWFYALLAYKPRGLEDIVMIYVPLALLAGLILLPFVASRGERSPLRRPWAIGAVLVTAILLGVLTGAGWKAPWVPDFASEPLSPTTVGVASGPAYDGARLFHAHACQSCHAVAGQGGAYGPDLTDVARRMPPQEIAFRIINGTANMPAYNHKLTLDELNAILVFLETIDKVEDGAVAPTDR